MMKSLRFRLGHATYDKAWVMMRGKATLRRRKAARIRQPQKRIVLAARMSGAVANEKDC